MKRELLLVWTSIILLIISNPTNCLSAIKLAENGESSYSIVLPIDVSKEEIAAARYLNDYLQKIATCSLPIIYSNKPISGTYIVISKSDRITCNDGFSITTSGDMLLINGGKNKGCIYGVCELLEKYLGVKYFSPKFVIIPKTKTINLPEINIEDSSPNTYRNINGEFIKNEDYKDFNRLNDFDDAFANNYYVHTFHKLIPWQSYFENHPEYFAQINGKRHIDQLCLTNPDVLKIVIEKLNSEMALQPNRNVWSVSQNDNYSYCQCDNCKKIIDEENSAAGPIIHFVNKVAAQFPNKIISTLAYQYSRKAPIKIKPAKNVQVMLCTIELNRSKPIATDSTSISFLNDIEDWGKICNHMYLWDYTVDFAQSTSPFPNLHTLQPNIQLFVKNNIKEHFQQTNTGIGHEFSELKSYILAKLLWNPNADVTKITEEFTDGFYGKAGVWIRKYIYHLQDEILKTGEWLDIYGPPTNYQNTLLSTENVLKYNYYFDEAEKAVDERPDHLLNVRIARMSLQYAIMEIGKNDMFGPRGWYTEKDGEFIPNKTMINILESFYKTSKDGGCSAVNESNLTAEEYYQSTKRFINVQVKNNIAFRKQVTATPLPAEKYSGGNLSVLTNGVRGANDYKVHWLGWESKDFTLILDLEKQTEATEIEISTLWDPKSWILHPISITCLVSENEKDFKQIGIIEVIGNQQNDEVNRTFTFKTQNRRYRFVKFEVKGTLKLFDWHPSAGGGSWVFVDEIVVR